MIWGHDVRGAEQVAATLKACQFAAITSNALKLNDRKQLKSLTFASLASKSSIKCQQGVEGIFRHYVRLESPKTAS
jgi:hypothetical protein